MKFLVLIAILFGLNSCEKADSSLQTSGGSTTLESETPKRYQTENIIIIVIDGPRYSETWGDSLHRLQPRLANSLLSEGVVYTRFFNNGVTRTNPGHVAITTGSYQELDNNGRDLPNRASIFQHWRKEKQEDSTKAWIIASKDKLEILANCFDGRWNNLYMPSTNCGVGGNGLGSGYREDDSTYTEALRIFNAHHPRLALINFKEPDVSGHQNDWAAYLDGIRNSDEYVYQIWNWIQQDSIYANKTTMFVTNDHGRHSNGHLDGFVSHGDDCLGCRHINLFAIGPDFKKGQIESTYREQRDISATVAELMGFDFVSGDGKVMQELFK